MSLPQVLHLLGAGMILGVGCFALARPEAFGRLIGIPLADAVGVSEVRAGFGGMLVGLSVFAAAVHDDLVYAAIGAAFLGATAARWIDIGRGNRERGIWVGLFVDSGVAILLLYPA